jgi:hypothetical protein
MLEHGMKPQGDENRNVLEQPAAKELSQTTPKTFKQLRTLRWPDLPTLLGLLAFPLRRIVHTKAFLELHTR